MWQALIIGIVVFAVVAWVAVALIGFAIKAALFMALVAAIVIGGGWLVAKVQGWDPTNPARRGR
jgi:hypothetical protein